MGVGASLLHTNIRDPGLIQMFHLQQLPSPIALGVDVLPENGVMKALWPRYGSAGIICPPSMRRATLTAKDPGR